MSNWSEEIQKILDRIDECIKNNEDDQLALEALAKQIGYSKFYTSKMFKNISGMKLKDYIRGRRLSFALKDLKDSDDSILSVAIKNGFSSNEAFSRAFSEIYGVTPSQYRLNPQAIVLRTILNPMDCYLLSGEFREMNKKENNKDVKVYYVHIPAHKYLHIRNYQSIGYWDFWQKQSLIEGQDCDTITSLLNTIKGKLDDEGSEEINAASGQLMAWINAPTGRICSWGIPLAESYGVRVPYDYDGEVPAPLHMMDVEEGEYIVFEHGPFDFETEGQIVEAKVEDVMRNYDYVADGYQLDLTEERVFYLYHDCERFFKYVRPVKKITE